MLEWNGIIKYFVFHYSILMFLFLYSFYHALFFKNVIFLKHYFPIFIAGIQWHWSFGVSSHCPPIVRLSLASHKRCFAQWLQQPPPAKSSGFASGFTLLVLTVAFIANNHPLLLKTCSLCFHCCFDSLPSARIILSHLSILLRLSIPK